MKFSPDLEKKVLEELENIPSIRRASKRVGLHHSTVYRWMGAHKEFHKKVIVSLNLGRDTINDMAESVIMNNIQKGETKAAVYWLSHNEHRYMTVEKSEQQSLVDNRRMKMLMSKETDEFDTFEELYKLLEEEELIYGYEQMKDVYSNLFLVLWSEDPNLKDIFFAGFENWKNKRMEKGLLKICLTKTEEMLEEAKQRVNQHEDLDSQEGLRHQSKDGDV